MNRRHPISCRQGTLLFLAIVCLTISACAGGTSSREAQKSNPTRPDESTRELRQSAQAGDAGAQNNLGLLYYEGKVVPQNHMKAKEWFDKAVAQGHAGAQVNLGTLYLRGEGAPQSSQMALFWFGRAAAQENALAFANLGMMYQVGRGVLQDFVQAHMWYNLSAAQGEPRSADARDALAKQMTFAQIAEAQQLAREWRPLEEKTRKTIY
jgi:uncharacterized protein